MNAPRAEGTARTQLLDLPMGRVQVREDGSDGALPLLLIHGFAGSLRVWDPMMDALLAERRVVRVDLPGHGDSDKPDVGYAIAAQAEAACAALDRLGVRRVVAVGHSAGGDVVVSMIEQQCVQVAGAVFLGTAPDLSFVHLPLAARMLSVPLLGPLMWRLATDAMLRGGLAMTFAETFPSVPDVYVADLRRMTHRSHVVARTQLEDYKRQQDLVTRMLHTHVPTMVVFGASDRWVDPRAADRWATIPGTRIELLPGVGHTHMAEAPGATAELVLDFARRIS